MPGMFQKLQIKINPITLYTLYTHKYNINAKQEEERIRSPYSDKERERG